MAEDETDPPPPKSGGVRSSPWLGPGGISAIAAVAAVVVTLIGIFVGLRGAEVAPATTSDTSASDETALFVYGSSMPGQLRYSEIAEYVDSSSRDAVDGMLYDSGLGYPLAKFGSGGTVPGFVLKLDPATAEAALRELTHLESGLFHPVTVRTQGGVTATAYEWIDATDGFPRIDAWDGSTAQYGESVMEAELPVGACYLRTPTAGEAITAWCDAPHTHEVYRVGTLTPAPDLVSQVDAECRAGFSAFIGIDHAQSQLETASASLDDGRYICAVHDPSSSSIGTLADVQR